MILDEIVSWYQKKIGTYDKEPWEKTVEMKILDGFNSGVTLKTAKLKTELIDVDLVRGSTFPKAKPKQSLTTVIRLSVLRYLFLPLYAQWWVKQTSPNAFGLLFFLYMSQMVNLAVYSYNVKDDSNIQGKADTNRTATYTNDEKSDTEHVISISELLIPMALSLLLSLIHSQIVATNIAQQSGSVKCKRRRYSNASQRSTGKLRRRKKLVKLRNHDQLENKKSGVNEFIANPSKSTLDVSTTNVVTASTSALKVPPSSLKIDAPFVPHNKLEAAELTNLENVQMSQTDNNCMGKRNVTFASHTQEKQQQTSPQSVSTTSSTHTSQQGDMSSLSSNSPNTSPIKTDRNDIEEFYDDLISRTTNSTDMINALPAPQPTPQNVVENENLRRTVGDDDGFESLNGKSSSGEDTNVSPQALRLRSVLNNHERVEQLMERKNKVQIAASNVEYIAHNRTINKTRDVSSDETEEEGDDGELVSSPASQVTSNCNDCTTSATEWLGITTNSDECSYSSDYDNSDDYKANQYSDEHVSDLDYTPNTILNPHGTSDRISCTVWDHREIKKAQMSVLEISSSIIENVELMPETNDYIYIGILFSFILSLIPSFCRLCEITMDSEKSSEINYFDLPMMLWEKASFSLTAIFGFAFGHTKWERTILMIGFINRLCLTMILFMIFSVAERTFKQRFLYAKLFSHLTSSRRARKSNLPHFRLNKVRNIKTWLSVRSYLKKRGPQRSVDIIVSAAFIVTLLLLAFLSVEWLKDSVHLHSHLNLEALMWSSTIGIFLLRFMTLGNKIHHKYRSVSVLITEQINLYLQIEKKPKKKDELMVSNSVLKLAADLLKELETPFKISGLSANPYLFTTIKVVILSALSGVLSEMLGFKLKLHKIKIK
ncbi:protein phtf-like [Haematobia irritans]|uniref:protein phtf-like n=1 Tax=Haematobia irritans TaxID=7368 RepID=UPI003F50413F